MYQSLHTTVIGPGRERIEIQIRTARDAPRRRARHRGALEVQGAGGGGIADQDAQRFGWLRQLLEWQKELKDPAEFLESVKVDLFQDEVYVFTPKGDVRVFPRGATPIDFAYAIHSQLGEHITGRAHQRQARAAPLQAAQRRRRRGRDLAQPAARARTGSTSSARPARALEDPQLPPRRAARQVASASGKSCSSASSTRRAICAEQAPQERRRDAASVFEHAQGAARSRSCSSASATARSTPSDVTRARRRRPTRRAARASRPSQLREGRIAGPRPQGHQARRRGRSAQRDRRRPRPLRQVL